METTPSQHDAPVDAGNIVASDWPRRVLSPAPPQRRDGFQVVIQKDVQQAIHAHGKSILDMEICGLLVGGVFHDDRGPWLHITGSIEGRHATHHAAQVTFTAATWDYAHEVLERDFPGQRIVGWYHTHPDFGVFLSGMDLFIQENFFNLQWQVALVYDPVQGDEGFFVWKGGKSGREPHIVHAGGWTDDTPAEDSAAPAPPPLPVKGDNPAAQTVISPPAPAEPLSPGGTTDRRWWALARRALDRFFS